MSDEDNNYDDFMLSDDEGMESIEMEDETDDEDKQNIEINEDNSQDDQDRGAARHKQHEQGTFEKHDRVEDICERIFEQGQALKEDERYKEARDLFLKIYYKEEFSSDESIERLMTWKFKSLIEILRLRALQLYFQKNGAQDLVLQILEDTATMSVFLQRIDFQIDGNIFELLSDTFEVLAPKWERVFLFDIEKVDRENMICKIEFQKTSWISFNGF